MTFKVVFVIAVPLLCATILVHIDAKPEKTAAEIARTTFPSVVLIAMEDVRGQPISLASGFFVDKDIVATNFHVIYQAAAGYAKVVGQAAKLNIKGIVGVDALHDIALLQLEGSSAPALAVASKLSVNVGDAVFAIGNPRGLEGTFSAGIISSVREFGPDHILQITAPISPGSSGGPVMDKTGTVVGVSVASIVNGQNLNFATLQKEKTELRPLKALSQAKVHTTLLGRLGNQPRQSGVAGTNFIRLFDENRMWTGGFTYSLENQLHEPVKDVVGIIVFYSSKGEPIDFVAIEYKGVIPPGLAKRLSGDVDFSVMALNCPGPDEIAQKGKNSRPVGKVEFRIFDFSVGTE